MAALRRRRPVATCAARAVAAAAARGVVVVALAPVIAVTVLFAVALVGSVAVVSAAAAAATAAAARAALVAHAHGQPRGDGVAHELEEPRLERRSTHFLTPDDLSKPEANHWSGVGKEHTRALSSKSRASSAAAHAPFVGRPASGSEPPAPPLDGGGAAAASAAHSGAALVTTRVYLSRASHAVRPSSAPIAYQSIFPLRCCFADCRRAARPGVAFALRPGRSSPSSPSSSSSSSSSSSPAEGAPPPPPLPPAACDAAALCRTSERRVSTSDSVHAPRRVSGWKSLTARRWTARGRRAGSAVRHTSRSGPSFAYGVERVSAASGGSGAAGRSVAAAERRADGGGVARVPILRAPCVHNPDD